MTTPASIARPAPATPAGGYSPHPLHADTRHWPQTNCYVDLWIELLHSWGADPLPALGFTAALDFEDDQFTFFKFDSRDLADLYGVSVQELAIYDNLQRHVETQAARGHVVLVEVDSFFLPDTRASAYRHEHTKTTIGIDAIDPARHCLSYFHNAGHYELEGDDYRGLFAVDDDAAAEHGTLFPYTEFVKRRGVPLAPAAALDMSLRATRRHLALRPQQNPLTRYRQAFPAHMERLIAQGPGFVHRYAFNSCRQLGANFELLGDYAAYLGDAGVLDPAPIAAAGASLAEGAKALQFRIARAVSRKRPDACDALMDQMEEAYQTAIGRLSDALGT